MKHEISFSEVNNFIATKLALATKLSTTQKKFLSHLFITFYTIPFRVNFLMMSRFSSYNEKTYRNRFADEVDLALLFHQTLLDKKGKELIFAFAPSFIKKWNSILF